MNQIKPPHHTIKTHHQNAGLKLTTLLHQSSPRTDQTILTPKILIIMHFNLYLYYLHNFNGNYNFN